LNFFILATILSLDLAILCSIDSYSPAIVFIRFEVVASLLSFIKTIHNEKSSISNINYKHSLKDSSKAVFKAKSIVNETALFSKAFQNCNTILLSDDATIFAQPHLEILIDELEASHGTTIETLKAS
jgi:Fe-S cluster assembly protein SufD